jgi:hypothetical protein
LDDVGRKSAKQYSESLRNLYVIVGHFDSPNCWYLCAIFPRT